MPQTLILLSPLVKHGGNYCTIKRIKSHLEGEGFECLLRDPNSLVNGSNSISGVERAGVMVGIHALRTGAFMRDKATPYILIIGGTDINLFCDDEAAMEVMTEAIYRARYVICFSEANKTRTLTLWPDIDRSLLKVIPQAVQTSLKSGLNLKVYLSSKTSAQLHEDPIVFVFVGGIRPVKNPLYLVKTFQEWHSRDPRIIYLMIGPKLDKTFATNVFEPVVNSAQGVIYIPGLPIEEVHCLVSQATALVNTSDTEGMCLAILEAMQLRVPVLASDVSGNRAIIEDGHTGLLFDSSESFLVKAQILLDNPGLRTRLTKEAAVYIQEHHNLQREREEYIKLLDQCFRDLYKSTQLRNGQTQNGTCENNTELKLHKKTSLSTNQFPENSAIEAAACVIREML